jgi:hypothetical protein
MSNGKNLRSVFHSNQENFQTNFGQEEERVYGIAS